MPAAFRLGRAALTLLVAAFASTCLAQAQKAPAACEPTSGQEGKDVVWVPTPQVVVVVVVVVVDKMLEGGLFETDFSKASVIAMFLLPDFNIKLRPKILALKPGTRIVSNSFTMGDWKEDGRATLSQEAGCNTSWCTALLWIVPAQART